MHQPETTRASGTRRKNMAAGLNRKVPERREGGGMNCLYCKNYRPRNQHKVDNKCEKPGDNLSALQHLRLQLTGHGRQFLEAQASENRRGRIRPIEQAFAEMDN